MKETLETELKTAVMDERRPETRRPVRRQA